jgi:membrane protease YdiL (CAAX protease family)
MIQVAIGIAGLLVMLILAAGAACWTVVLLKLVATSRYAPEPLAPLAAQLLVALNIKPHDPLVPWSPRRPVPWALVDLMGTFLLYLFGIFAIRVLLDALGWLPSATDETKLTLADKGLLVWANIGASLGLLVVALPLIALRTGATWRDFGFSVRELWTDLKLGLAGFVMLAPPVYAIQGVLVYFWQPSKHPLMEMFKDSPDASFFVVLFVAAAIVAPIFEELIFRVLLQGLLEKLFSFVGTAPEFVFEVILGIRVRATPAPLLSPQAAEGSPQEVLFIPDSPYPNSNPYTPPVIVHDHVVPAEFSDDGQLGPLCGPPAWLPIGISSIFFALLHYSHGPDWVALTLLAAGMGYLYQRTHRVVPSLIVHALLNGLSMFGLWLQVYGPPELGH